MTIWRDIIWQRTLFGKPSISKEPFWQAIIYIMIWQKYLWQAGFLTRSKFNVIVQKQWNHLEIQSFQGTKTKCPTLQNVPRYSQRVLNSTL